MHCDPKIVSGTCVGASSWEECVLLPRLRKSLTMPPPAWRQLGHKKLQENQFRADLCVIEYWYELMVPRDVCQGKKNVAGQ